MRRPCIEPVPRRRRAVIEIRHEYSFWCYATLGRHGPVRRLQGCARPDQHAVEILSVQGHGVYWYRALLVVAPDGRVDLTLLHGTLDFTEAIHRLTVYGQ